ncbi:MAG: hypothetical protein ACRC2T_12395 [Thermoguttaceae bacterium]
MAESISRHSLRFTANVDGLLPQLTKVQESLGLIRDESGNLRNASGQLVEGLSAMQIKMGLYVDESGKLVNAQGKLVETLSNARIQAGDYVDSLGQLRNANDQIVQGVSAAQRAVGLYKNEMGDLVNAQGEVVKQSAETIAAIKAQEAAIAQAARDAAKERIEAERESARIIKEEQAAILQAAKEAARERAEAERAAQMQTALLSSESANLKNSLVATAGQIGTMTTLLGQMTGHVNGGTKSLIALSAAVSVFKFTTDAVKLTSSAYKAFTSLTWQQFTAQMSLNAASGNFVGLALGTAAAIGTAGLVLSMTQSAESTDKAAESVDKMSGSLQRLQDIANKRTGGNGFIIGEDIAQLMQETGKNSLEKLNDGIKKWEEYQNKIKELQDTRYTTGKGEERSLLDDALQNEKSGQRKILEQLKSEMVDPATLETAFQNIIRAELTPLQKMEEQIEYTKKVIESGLDKTGSAAQALAIQERKRQEMILNDEKQAFEKNLAEIKQANKETVSALDAARASLIPYSEIRKQQEESIETLRNLRDAQGNLLYSENELAKASENMASDLRKKSLGNSLSLIEEASKLFLSDSEKESAIRERYLNQMNELIQKHQDGLITLSELDITRQLLQKKSKEEIDKISESKFDSAFKSLSELRKPLEDRIKESFDEIEKAGLRLGATADEMQKIKTDERKRLEELYGLKKAEAEKSRNANTQGSLAVAGSVEAFNVTVASAQDRTTQAVKETKTAIEKGNVAIAAAIRDSAPKYGVV